ncbi:universal stress protein [Cyclobacterium amurskyense]|uniref:Putative universal stress protein UspA n=1 Tax=Cyclobacterium amurskyense TaxID=320787 RepID=A0A0H4PIL7_9BACT|nr:universal stress protein [Cyclobacterium amurskyense]AKP52773.1 Putative universal stress protein UspA [Cyclobacterium amurskyense]
MKILVPTDLSENADNALTFAVSYAQQQCASITLIFSYFAVYDFAAEAARMAQTIESNANSELQKIKERLGNTVDIDYKIIQGTVSTAIFSTANNGDFDLIIMGTQGASGIKKNLIGSNTATVIKESAIPVIAVPFCSSFESIKNIKVAVDLKNEKEGVFKKLITLTETWNLPYKIIHVENKPDFNKDIIFKGLEAYLNENFPDSEFTFEKLQEVNTDKGLENYIKNKSDSLLVMFTKDRGFLDFIFKNSHSAKMVYHTHIPLLVIK